MLAIIGGSANAEPDAWSNDADMAPATPYGDTSSPISLGRLGNAQALFLARHGRAQSIAPHRINYRANLWALQQLGATTVIALNAVGGIAEFARPGSILLPEQIIDYTWGREHSYYDGSTLPLRHQEFSLPFSERLRGLLHEASRDARVEVEARGVYGCTQGPRLETAAEIERLARDGCDMVGMTAMPEAALAAELGLDYACLAMVVNWAAGRTPGPVSIDEIPRHGASCRVRVDRILDSVVLSSRLLPS